MKLSKILLGSCFIFFCFIVGEVEARNLLTSGEFSFSSDFRMAGTYQGKWFREGKVLKVLLEKGKIFHNHPDQQKIFQVVVVRPYLAKKSDRIGYQTVKKSQQLQEIKHRFHYGEEKELVKTWFEFNLSEIPQSEWDQLWLGFSIITIHDYKVPGKSYKRGGAYNANSDQYIFTGIKKIEIN